MNESADKFTVIDPITRAKNITKNVYMSEEIMKEIKRWWGCIEKYKEEIDSYNKGEEQNKVEDLSKKIEENLLLQFMK